MRAGCLLDTDWIIDHLNGVAAVTMRLNELRPAGLAVSPAMSTGIWSP